MALIQFWNISADSFQTSKPGWATCSKTSSRVYGERLGKATGIKCNPHSFRRGFGVHQVKSGLSNKVIRALGGWETPNMASHYAASLTFDDALSIYKAVNSDAY